MDKKEIQHFEFTITQKLDKASNLYYNVHKKRTYMKKIDPIITRLEVHLNVKTRKEVREKWDIPKNTFDTWVNRDNIPKKRIDEIAEREGLNRDWIEHGIGEKFKIQKVASS